MSTLKYFCNQCGYVSDKPVSITQHLNKCDSDRNERMERYKKKYQKGKLWLERLVMNNSKSSTADIDSEFTKAYHALVLLYNILLVGDANNEATLSSRAEYMAELSSLYADALTIQVSNSVHKTKLSSFMNSLDSTIDLESETMSATTAETEITESTVMTETTESTVVTEAPPETEQKNEFAKPESIRQLTLNELVRLKRATALK